MSFRLDIFSLAACWQNYVRRDLESKIHILSCAFFFFIFILVFRTFITRNLCYRVDSWLKKYLLTVNYKDFKKTFNSAHFKQKP